MAVIALPDVLQISWLFGFLEMLLALVLYVMLMRFGFLTMVSALMALQLCVVFPMTLQSSAWYSTAGFGALFLISAISLFGFWTSFGGRPILDTLSAED